LFRSYRPSWRGFIPLCAIGLATLILPALFLGTSDLLGRPTSGMEQAASVRVGRSRPVVATLLFAALCLSTTGCVRRRLTVRTNPPGAQVFVDDQEIGTTPCSAAFVYYGTRKITLMKDGYRTETIFQK